MTTTRFLNLLLALFLGFWTGVIFEAWPGHQPKVPTSAHRTTAPSSQP